MAVSSQYDTVLSDRHVVLDRCLNLSAVYAGWDALSSGGHCLGAVGLRTEQQQPYVTGNVLRVRAASFKYKILMEVLIKKKFLIIPVCTLNFL